MVVVAAAFLVRRLRNLSVRAAVCIFLCGILFAFANPPLQTPDESDHYLRTYAISLGRFDFDYNRTYPDDVASLLDAFPGAWVNAHTSVGIGTDPDTGADKPYDTAGYALKQYGDGGQIQSIADSFAAYRSSVSDPDSELAPVHEPVSFLILPFLPGAVGMAVARLFGLGALGCLYGGRIGNLLAYTVLCYMALRAAKRYRPVFFCIMLLPLSLFMGASLSYDATLLGCYYLMAALLTRDCWTTRTAAVYAAACIFVNIAKPYLNLLWVLLPLILLAPDLWKAKGRRWLWCVGMAGGSLAATLGVEVYGRLMRHNYPVIARQGGQAVDSIAQLMFVLRNPLRTISVFLGTLYENDFFLGQLGLFGWKDLPISLLNLLGPVALLAAAPAQRRAGPRFGAAALGRIWRVCGCLYGRRYGGHVHHLHSCGYDPHRGAAGAVFPAGFSCACIAGCRTAAPCAGPAAGYRARRAAGLCVVCRPCAAWLYTLISALLCRPVLYDSALSQPGWSQPYP